MKHKTIHIVFIVICIIFVACSPSNKAIPGPDKQGSGALEGAVVGAGTGAITGAQVSAGTGPGAFVGAGVGFVAGAIQGYAADSLEDQVAELQAKTDYERKVAFAHETLNEHYEKRIDLHPARDIFPADLFFFGDSYKLRPSAEILVEELAKLNKERAPWSRLLITCYVKSSDPKSDYARSLAEKRSKELGIYFVRAGIEPRRVKTKAIITKSPLVVDPLDDPARYSQAIELTQIDR
ncbi:MAG: hypothetical protein KDD56_00740 [Bdellovibrionales bacterium]|nr:hypothetical protein [Bdellovibrionales bacterium]